MQDPVLFAGLAALAIAIYVMADGFDLGVGILFPFAPGEAERDIMMAGLEPTWDGNETWLVMGGTLLWAAFPAAYYVLLPAFYLPVMLMLAALVLRGVAFSFRGQPQRVRQVWDRVFAAGSVLATFAQGLILGGVVDGVAMRDGMFAGGPLDFLGLLGVLCGFGLLGGYALLGAGWLVWRGTGSVQDFARRAGRVALVLAAGMIGVVSLWTAATQPEVAARWFGWPTILWLAPVPLATLVVVAAAWRSFRGGRDSRPFLLGIALFLLGFGGLVVSLWPYVVPRSLTVWDAASDPQSLGFIGPGLLVILPVVLAYQAQAYWLFRGKTTTRQDHA